MIILLVYLVIINAASLSLMLADKIKAIKKKWRIPESILLSVCVIGGSLGGLVGIRLFRHKTLHPKFSIGVPAMLAVHIVLLVIILAK